LTTAGDPGHWAAQVLAHAKADPLWRVHEVLGPAPWLDEERVAEQRRSFIRRAPTAATPGAGSGRRPSQAPRTRRTRGRRSATCRYATPRRAATAGVAARPARAPAQATDPRGHRASTAYIRPTTAPRRRPTPRPRSGRCADHQAPQPPDAQTPSTRSRQRHRRLSQRCHTPLQIAGFPGFRHLFSARHRASDTRAADSSSHRSSSLTATNFRRPRRTHRSSGAICSSKKVRPTLSAAAAPSGLSASTGTGGASRARRLMGSLARAAICQHRQLGRGNEPAPYRSRLALVVESKALGSVHSPGSRSLP